jgi:HEPN domain-containing protein
MPVATVQVSTTPAEALGLEEVKALILKKVPAVQLIVHLGTHQKPFTYYLLVLIADGSKAIEHEVSNTIEDHCKHLVSVMALVHKTGSAKKGISEGNTFWNNTMKSSKLIYQQEGLHLQEHQDVPKEDRQEIAKYHRQRWGGQAQEFLKGAKRYYQDGNHKLAAFLLHQAVESALSGVIRAAMGYRIAIHNLSRMLRLTLLFTEELLAVFELHTEEGKQSFALLQNAYSHARYRDGFEPGEEAVKMLLSRVETLLGKTEDIYERYIPITVLQEPELHN